VSEPIAPSGSPGSLGLTLPFQGTRTFASVVSSNGDLLSLCGHLTDAVREKVIQENADANGGTNKCEICNGDVMRVQNRSGVRPPDNQLHLDHVQAVANGGTNDVKNLRVTCRICNLKKGAE
jgi:hypothetical protein